MAALAPIAALALAGCQWTSTVQTDEAYEPADGRSTTLGGVQVNNLLVVSDRKGGEGTLVGLGVNKTNQDVEVSFALAGGQPIRIEIPSHSSKQISDPDNGPMSTLPNIPVEPGGLVDVDIVTAGAGGQSLRVPVLAPYPPYGDYHESGPLTHAPTAPAAHGDGH
ncbi:hypothetical protein GCM10025883_30260 [Mobilicoccus caccae]|uniref:Copper(I)-binding protein n=2 Tax=Mobilicoccus caccae TaxID=1859295 RepID=A0ABQ6IVA3_9MICO|nr:hypothetical protein GCM10025883_30260 [Mobilicoccus caccae]